LEELTPHLPNMMSLKDEYNREIDEIARGIEIDGVIYFVFEYGCVCSRRILTEVRSTVVVVYILVVNKSNVLVWSVYDFKYSIDKHQIVV
jgi:hypothetical protein